jgi:single-strand DNA-binding protein
MVNMAILIGRTGGDPEMRYTADGTPVATFTLATSEKRKNAAGETVEHTEWHRVVAWRKLAEIVGAYVTKGHLLYIEGRITNREYTDKDGNKRKTTEIVAQSLKMLGNRNGNGQQQAQGGGGTGRPAQSDPDFPHEDWGDIAL